MKLRNIPTNGEPQEAYSLGGATGEEVVYIVY